VLNREGKPSFHVSHARSEIGHRFLDHTEIAIQPAKGFEHATLSWNAVDHLSQPHHLERQPADDDGEGHDSDDDPHHVESFR
jgi:hypothetical protein